MIQKNRLRPFTLLLSVIMTATVVLAACQTAPSSQAEQTGKVETSNVDTTTPPPLNVTLRPHSSGAVTDYMDVEMKLPEPELESGKMLVEIPVMVASVPSQQYKKNDIKASDNEGEIPLQVVEGKSKLFGPTTQFAPQRATSGDVTLSYRAYPRKVDSTTKGGPYFDLRQEADGLNGAGNSFLALPDDSKNYTIHLKWDLRHMPANASGVWSYGEGDVTKIGPASLLANTYYATGNLQKFKPSEDSKFAIYWMGEQEIDTKAVGEKVGTLFNTISKTFKDGDEPYKIFIRKNPYDSTGGTALLRSFMFGYSNKVTPTAESIQLLLAHEMVHNWVELQGGMEDKTLFAEGAAEFFSLFESHKANVLSEDELLAQINEKLLSYYTNPFNGESNKALIEKSWAHHAAQRVPYGRGLVYMLRLDDQIRTASNGQATLNTVVLELLDRKAAGKPYGKKEFFSIIDGITGKGAEAEYEKMAAGEMMAPPESYFSSNYKLVETTEKQVEFGFDDTIFNGEKKIVKGLIPGSNAELDGLKNGDEILAFSNRNEVEDIATKSFELKVKRGDKELNISYLPRGKEVTVYQYVKK